MDGAPPIRPARFDCEWDAMMIRELGPTLEAELAKLDALAPGVEPNPALVALRRQLEVWRTALAEYEARTGRTP